MRKRILFIAVFAPLMSPAAVPVRADISDASPESGETVTVDDEEPNPATSRIISYADNVIVKVLENAGFDVDASGSFDAAIDVYGDNWRVENAGTISANQRGLYLRGGAEVINKAGGVILGAFDDAVHIHGPGVVINAGTIDGQNADAIQFDHTAPTNDQLILKPGSIILGQVAGEAGTDTLTLGGDSGSDTFNVSDIGASAQYQSFEVFTKDGNATWTLTGMGSQNWTVAGGMLIGDADALQGNIINNATIVFDQATHGTYAGAISGSGLLIKTGPGTLTLTGDSAYTGNIHINQGTLRLDHADVLDSTGDVIVDGGTLDVAFVEELGRLTLVNGSVVGGRVTATEGYYVESGTISATLEGAGSLIKTTGGTLILSGDNTYTGGTTLMAGTLKLAHTNALGSGTFRIEGGTVLPGDYYYVNTDAVIAGDFIVGYDGVSFDDELIMYYEVDLAGGERRITVEANAEISFLDSIRNGSLVIDGQGTAYFSGSASNSFNTLTLRNPTTTFRENATSAATDLVIEVGSTVELSSQLSGTTHTLASLAGGGAVEYVYPSPTTLRIAGDAETTFAGDFIGELATGSLVRAGTGTTTLTGDTGALAIKVESGALVLAGAHGGNLTVNGGTATLKHDTTGDVVLSAGRLNLATDDAIGGTLTIAGGRIAARGADRMLNAALSITGDFAIVGSHKLTATGAVDLNGGPRAIDLAEGAGLKLTGTIDNGTLIKTGGGKLILTGNNTYTGGTKITGGTLRVSGSGGAIDHTNANMLVGVGSGGHGTLRIVSGGTVSSRSGFIGAGANAEGAVRVEGTNSTWINSGNLYVADEGTGILTITNGGAVKVHGGTGTVYVANGAGSQGTLNIGAAPGDPATAPGALGAGKVVFGDGTGAINFNHTDNHYTFAPDVTGDGTVNVLAGTTILTGTNTYSGGTTVSGGTLVGDTDSLQGKITNHAAVVFDQAIDGTYAGDMSGTGSLTKTGAGTLTLTGTNTYSGGTIVSGGTLVGDTDSLQGKIINHAAVVFDQAIDGTYAGDMSGTGSLTKTGAGTLTLTGTSTYTGQTVVRAGRLAVQGSLASPVMLRPGTVLSGVGSVGGIDAEGATVAPGNSIGTMRVTGDVMLAEGSTVAVSAVGGDELIQHGDQWTIITADGGVTDHGAAVMENFAGFSFLGEVSGNHYLLIAQSGSLIAEITDPMARRPGAALDADRGMDEQFDRFMNRVANLSIAGATRALRASTPANVATTQWMQRRVTQRFHWTLGRYLRGRRLGMPGLVNHTAGKGRMARATEIQLASAASDPRTLGRLLAQAEQEGEPRGPFTLGEAEKDDARLGGFAMAYTVRNDLESDADTLGAQSSTYAGQFGLDYMLGDHWLVGLSFSYAQSDIDFARGRGGNKVATYRVGPYVGFEHGPWFADASLTYALHRNDLTRRVPATGDTFTAEYESQDVAAYLGGGYDFELGGWQLTPRASLQYIHAWTDSYRESGGGGALAVESAEFDSWRSTLGVSVSRRFDVGNTALVPHAGLGWTHEYLDDGEELSARFIGGATAFTIATAAGGDRSIYYSAGLSALFSERISLDVTYRGETFENGQTHALTARVVFEF